MAPKPTPLKKLLAPVRSTLGDPKLSGPVLIALLLYPQHLQSILPAPLSWVSPALTRTFGFFFGLSVVKIVSAKLSQWGLNNYRPDAVFVKSEELVLITGGASGIGELTAREFVERGVKVIILDIHPPKESLRKPFPTCSVTNIKLTSEASGITFYECDVTSTTQIKAVGDKIRQDHGDPTVLVCYTLFCTLICS